MKSPFLSLVPNPPTTNTKCQYGFDVATCHKDGVAKLKECGFSDAANRANCNNCKIPETLETVLMVGREGFQKKAVAVLQSYGLTDAAQALQQPPKTNTDFHCPIVKAKIVSPCQLKKCKYWVNSSGCNNCILIYSQRKETDRLTSEEIAKLYSIPKDEVATTISGAMAKLRSAALTVAQETDELRPKFTYLMTVDVCCVCEAPTPVPLPAYLKLPFGLAYCSRACKAAKPKRLIELERQYGNGIADILKWAVTKFKTMAAVEQSLSINRWLLCESVSRYLGQTCQEFFPRLRTKQTKRNRSTSNASE